MLGTILVRIVIVKSYLKMCHVGGGRYRVTQKKPIMDKPPLTVDQLHTHTRSPRGAGVNVKGESPKAPCSSPAVVVIDFSILGNIE